MSIRRHVSNVLRASWMRRAEYRLLRFPVVTFFEGGWFLAYPDEIGYLLFFKRSYENKQRSLFSQMVKTGKVQSFYDVGANQGLYTLIAARYLRSGPIVAFEPVVSEAKKLERNASLNRYAHVIIERLALGASEGVGDLFVCHDGQSGYSSLRPPSEDVKSRRKVVRVQVTTLDNYVKSRCVSSVDLIKIDAEGAEREILEGSGETLSQFRPLLMMEVEDRRTRAWGYLGKDIISFLRERNYIWFEATVGGHLVPHEAKQEYGWENLIAVPSEKVPSIDDLRMDR